MGILGGLPSTELVRLAITGCSPDMFTPVATNLHNRKKGGSLCRYESGELGLWFMLELLCVFSVFLALVCFD